MKVVSIIISAFVLSTMLISCKKYLDKKSSTNLQTPETVNDIQALLDNSYKMNFVTPSFGETSSDDYFVSPSNLGLLYSSLLDNYKWQPVPYEFPNDWADSYQPVYYANLCLESIDRINRSNSNLVIWDNVKGSALFFRAYYFLNLLWTFSKAYDQVSASTDLGIALRLNSDYNIKSKRENVKQGYEQVIKDLKASIKYLTISPIHVVRPSKQAAYGELARCYLSMRQYDSAFKYANLSLEIKHDLINYNDPGQVDIASDIPFGEFNKEIIFYSQMTGNYSAHFNNVGYVDTSLYSFYEDNDLRKSTLYLDAGNGYFSFKGSYAGNGYDFFTGITVAEMLLIRAECYARGVNGNQGDLTKGLSDINSLLSNRYDGTFSGVQLTNLPDLLDRVLLERRKELVFRGLRWSDIKRLNKESRDIELMRFVDGTPYLLHPGSPYFALPLPSDIISYPDMPQNPY